MRIYLQMDEAIFVKYGDEEAEIYNMMMQQEQEAHKGGNREKDIRKKKSDIRK
jgi:hypothetical protein